MTTKTFGLKAPDGSNFGVLTDGAGTLTTISHQSTGSAKQNLYGSQAPDGSTYMTLTNGSGTLI